MGWRVSLLPVLCPTLVPATCAEVLSPTPDMQRKPRRSAAPPEREEKWGAGGEPAALFPGSLTSCFLSLCREKEVKCKS